MDYLQIFELADRVAKTYLHLDMNDQKNRDPISYIIKETLKFKRELSLEESMILEEVVVIYSVLGINGLRKKASDSSPTEVGSPSE